MSTSAPFAEPPRVKATPPSTFQYAVPGPDEEGDELWHLYVPGADFPPCGGRYHQPRRTPRPHAAVVAEGKPVCQHPACFGDG
ncbi:MAG TPA: hypothetical protein VFN04_06970 [Protaetiibacter sp.]|nr:hypothetical protein [Protaetiibacter sp.]